MSDNDDVIDAKKRAYEMEDIPSTTSKKRSFSAENEDIGDETKGRYGLQPNELTIKFLCPSSVTGSLIGKGGSVIAELHAKHEGVRVKFSQNNDFFPGTNERVLSLTGTQGVVCNAITDIVTRVYEAKDKLSSHDNYLGGQENSRYGAYKFVFKLLIPWGAAGIIIGKSGSVIKEMSEISSCKMQLAEAQDPFNTKERIMSISSDTSTNIIQGLHTVVAHLFSEPTFCVYQNHRLVYTRRVDEGNVFRGGPQVGGFPSAAGGFGASGSFQASYPTTSYEYMQPFAGPQVAISRYHVDQMAASCGLSAPAYKFDGRSLEISLAVPSAWIGIILGKGGNALKETMSVSRTLIQVSQKEGGMDSQAVRTLKIKGQESNSNYAYSLIVETLYNKVVQQK